MCPTAASRLTLDSPVLLVIVSSPRLERSEPRAEPAGSRAEPYGRHIPQHIHVTRHGAILAGHRESEPWFGHELPARVPGLGPGEVYQPAPPYLKGTP